MKKDSITGCILGTAVGDAIGLPFEGLGPCRALKMFSDLGRHHLIFGKGMVSDDTEHTCFLGKALIKSDGDIDKFERSLAWSLRFWLLGLPAGIGLATLRSIMKLWLGLPPKRSGVFSAGNGPAMRSALLGVLFGDNPAKLSEYVKSSTRITHTDPKAYFGALAVALASHRCANFEYTLPDEFLQLVCSRLEDQEADEFIDLLKRAAESAEKNESVAVFAERIGSKKGISGYMYHTVPCVIQVWFRFQRDYEGGIREILAAGGDTDTTAAILGGIIGAGTGKAGIPAGWLNGIREWPRSVAWMERLGEALYEKYADKADVGCPGYFVPGVPVRNLFFLVVILFHGFRRLLPPY